MTVGQPGRSTSLSGWRVLVAVTSGNGVTRLTNETGGASVDSTDLPAISFRELELEDSQRDGKIQGQLMGSDIALIDPRPNNICIAQEHHH